MGAVRWLVALTSMIAAYSTEVRFLQPILIRWLDGRAGYWKRLAAYYLSIQVFFIIVILLPIAVVSLLGDGTVGGGLGPPVPVGRFARNTLWAGNAVGGLVVVGRVVLDILRPADSSSKESLESRPADSESASSDPKVFREDVATWRAGQTDAARRYKAWFNRLFSRHN